MRLVVLAAIVAYGCKSEQPPLTMDIDPVSEADAKAFAEKLVPIAKSCDEKKAAPFVDQQAMSAKWAKTSKLPNTDKPARDLAKTTLGARILCQFWHGIGEYKLLRLTTVDGQPHAVMRRLILDPETGATLVGYDELQLGTSRRDHQVRIVDAYTYPQGQWLSQLFGGNLEAFAGSLDMIGEVPRMTGDVRKARELQRGGKNKEAIAVIDALPLDARSYRPVQLLRVRAASQLGPEAYKEALAQLDKTFPNDPAAAMLELDGALTVGDYDSALKYIDVIDKAIGPDPFQETNRAFAYFRKGDLDNAIAHADAAIKAEPGLTRAWQLKMDISLARKRWADVVAAITELETKHGFQFNIEKMKTAPPMAEFAQSAEFKDWAAKHK
jgi:tetratricopeptide (TPR) repeat protein